MFWGSNSSGGGIFCTCPDWPWGPSSHLYPPPSKTEVKERLELYIYSPSGPSWPVLGELYLYLLHTGKYHK